VSFILLHLWKFIYLSFREVTSDSKNKVSFEMLVFDIFNTFKFKSLLGLSSCLILLSEILKQFDKFKDLIY